MESFNGRLRDECLNVHWFLSIADARAKIEAWRQDYNENRHHASLGWMTSVEYATAAATKEANELWKLTLRLDEKPGAFSYV